MLILQPAARAMSEEDSDEDDEPSDEKVTKKRKFV